MAFFVKEKLNSIADISEHVQMLVRKATRVFRLMRRRRFSALQ